MVDPSRLFFRGFDTVLGYYPEYREKHYVINSIRISLCGLSIVSAINYGIVNQDLLKFGLSLFGYGIFRFYPRILGYKSGQRTR